MKVIDNENILAFEYFTASGVKDKCIISEAEAIIYSLLNDLRDFKVDLIVNESFKYLADDFDNVNPIVINQSLEKYLKENASNYSRAIFVAAENDNILFDLTKILEENGVLNYTSLSEACLDTSDKFRLYELLFGVVPQPRTFKIKIDSKGYWKRAVTNLYKKWQAEDPLSKLKIIIKPLTGVDCENIAVIDDINNLSYDLENIFPPESRVIVQEYIEGEDISVSLIVNEGKVIPLTINKQFVRLLEDKVQYVGGKSPYESNFGKEILDIAVKACKEVKGLKGFVGVDLRVNSDETDLYNVYLLEINSRFTTPYVGLQKIADFNIVKSIIELIDKDISFDELKNKVLFTGEVEYMKKGNNLIIEEFKE